MPPEASPHLRYAVLTDVGMRRSVNQDSVGVAPSTAQNGEDQVFIVADGMGAHAAGELASKIAVDCVPHAYLKSKQASAPAALRHAVREANSQIFAKGSSAAEFHGMGTTCSCLVLSASGALAAHVGDSRVYRLRDKQLEQLTYDHSLVWEMAEAIDVLENEVPACIPKNVITRSLGPHERVKVDLEGPHCVEKGDVYLLCSDGLCGVVEDPLLGAVLDALPPKEAAQTLVDLANLSGGPDNISAIVIEVQESAHGKGSCKEKGSGMGLQVLGSSAAAILFLAMFTWFLSIDYSIGMLFSAAACGATAVLAIMGVEKSNGSAHRRLFEGPYGNGPYRHADCRDPQDAAEALRKLVAELSDVGEASPQDVLLVQGQPKFDIDFKALQQARNEADRRVEQQRYGDAVLSYCQIVRDMMDQSVGRAGAIRTGFSGGYGFGELSFAHRAAAARVSPCRTLGLPPARPRAVVVRILTRYVLFELLQIFLLSLAGLTALIFIALIGKEAVSKGLGLGPLLRMSPYLLPQAMQFAVPGTMLLATTSVYGRLSAFNEVVAVKSLGVSPWALVKPTIVLAAVTSLGAVALNDLAVSWGRLGVQRVFVESIEEVIYNQLHLHRTYSAGRAQINVRRVEGRKLIRPTLTVQRAEGEQPLTVTAASAELRSDPARHKLVVTFTDLDVDGPIKIWDPSEFTHEIDLEELVGGGGRSTSTFSLTEIGSEVVRSRQSSKDLQWEKQAESTLAMLTGDFDRLSSEAWTPLENRTAGLEHHLRRLGVEPYRRWANGFSCLCFVMIGAPMAILRQKGEFLASFFLCFLPILLVYYPLLMASVDAAKSGTLPPAVVWVGNLVLAVWGLAMMRRVNAH